MKCFAEFETDRIVYETYFQGKVGCIVEVGCADPYLYSMSMLFRNEGWRCIGVEPNPKFIQKHRDLGHEIYPYAATESLVGPSDFDLVSTPMGPFTYESFSSLRVKPEYNKKYGVVCIEEVIQVSTFQRYCITERFKVLFSMLYNPHCSLLRSLVEMMKKKIKR